MEKNGIEFIEDLYYYDEDDFQAVQLFPKEKTQKLADHYREILKLIGENPDREGLQKTPMRVAKALQFILQGYHIDPEKILRSAVFKEDFHFNDIILVKNIELYSMCEHHMIPFFGKAHVAYIPNGKVTGLSKIPRVVDAFARRLQIQERLTQQIHDCINKVLEPKGVAVIIEAYHLCMMMRGVQKQNSYTVTVAKSGEFNDPQKFNQLINMIGLNQIKQ